MFIFSLILFAVSFLLSVVLRPKPKIENARPAHLGDFKFPTATEGRVVPLVWGTVKITGPNVVWFGDLRNLAIKTDVPSGLFSTDTQITGFKYGAGLQMAICRGEVDVLKTVWVGDRVLFAGSLGEDTIKINRPNFFGGDESGLGGMIGLLTFYRGTATQTTDPYLDAAAVDFLWQDVFGLGAIGQPLNQFLGSSVHAYYQTSKQDLHLGPVTPSNLTALVTSNYNNNYGTPPAFDGSIGVHVLGLFPTGSVVPNGGLTDNAAAVYCAMLMHPFRPQMSDNIKVKITFQCRGSDTTNLSFGCKVNDRSSPSNAYGVFGFISNESTVSVVLEAPGSSGAHIQEWTAPTDFPSMAGINTMELNVIGNLVRVFLNGAFLGSVTDARIANIPSDNTGFCINQPVNLNSGSDFSINYSAGGIYSLTIDSLLRQATSTVPAYRGTCYAVYNGYFGNSTQIQPWAFEIQRTPNPLALLSGKHQVNGHDCNPANVLYEIITDKDWGLGFSSSDVDLTSFSAAADVLYTEGNGWSFVLDNATTAADLINEIERQIDGYVFIDRTAGKWKITLARGGYTVLDLPLFDDTNIRQIKQFTRGGWDETSNHVRVQFANRNNSYGTTYAVAQDPANVLIQGSNLVADANYPGVKDATLANQLAWRDLRVHAYPLAKLKIRVDRHGNLLNPGDLFRWTCSRYNATNLAMRVINIDLGTLEDGTIEIDAVQDVFAFATPAFAPPGPSAWYDPAGTTPINIAVTERQIFEAPWAMERLAGSTINRVWVGARNPKDGSGTLSIYTNENGDDYTLSAQDGRFAMTGKLAAGLNPGANGGTFNVLADADTVADIVAVLTNSTARDVGRSLVNLILIDTELLAFTTFTDNTTSITLSGVYRAMLDTVQGTHAINTRVWFLRGVLTGTGFTASSLVGVKLQTHNQAGDLPIALASPSFVTLSNRDRRPYPPVLPYVNTVFYPAFASLDIGTFPNDYAVSYSFTRRDWRNTDEVAAYSEANLPADFPSANSTTYVGTIRLNPAGSNLLAATQPLGSANNGSITRNKLIRANSGIAPVGLSISILASHVVNSVSYDAGAPLVLGNLFVVSTLLTQHAFGAVGSSVPTNAYTAGASGTFTLNTFNFLMSAGAVQVSINAGTYFTVIPNGFHTGTFSATAGDFIQLKCTMSGDPTHETFCELLENSTAVAYALFILG